MKPLFIVHTEASFGWGGQEIRVLSEMAGMVERGHRVLLFCPAEAGIHAGALKRGIPVEALPIGKKRLPGFLAMRKRLKELKPDLVITHSSTDSWLAALATRGWNAAPAIVRIRHISAPVRQTASTRWLYSKAADHLVTTGERLREELIRDLQLPEFHVTSVPTGIDLGRFAPRDKVAARQALGLPEQAFIVGIVATLRSWKGHRFLLDAFAALANPNSRLLVVGDGPGRDNLHQQAAQLGISDRVVMPGNLDDVAPWMAAMDVFVLPSYANEGVPQAIMQAMAMGLPIISTPVGSIPEIVADGETGILVPPRDVPALTDAIKRLAADPALCRRLGDAGAARARERFSATLMLDRMEDISRRAIQHRHPA